MESLQEKTKLPPLQSSNGDEEKNKLYRGVIQNIKRVIERATQFEVDAEKLINNLKSKLEMKQKKEREFFEAFKKLRHGVIAKAKSRSSSDKGNGLDQSSIAEFEEEEGNKRKEIDAMRLVLIRTKKQVQKLEKKLKSKEKLDEELDFIGFEQLQSENSSLQKKLENRKKEITRYRNKLKENFQKISTLTKNIKDAEIASQKHEESIKTVDKEISRVSRQELSLLTQLKELQKNSKIQSADLSNRVVQEYISSMDDEKNVLTSSLESLKTKHFELTQ